MVNSKKRTILITGGSSGIGFEMARQMLDEGSKVIICGRTAEKLNDAKKKLPQLNIIQCDISSEEERKTLVERITKEYPDFNMLMNNAGIARRYLLSKTGDLTERLEVEWRTNYFAPVILTQLLLPLLSKNHGTLVNVSSGLAHIPLSIEPNYCATKAALHSMTQSMRVQYEKIGVDVAEIFYPEVNTPFQEGHASERAISPKEAAGEALKQLNQGKDEIHVKMSKMLYLLSRLMPKRGLKIMNGQITKEIETLLHNR